MNLETAPTIGDATHHSISILAVITPERSMEVQRILSLTQWRTHVVSSIHEAVQALQSLSISVVLCEDTLPDGKWLNVMRETERLCPRPQTIVVSPRTDTTLWGEVLNCGGYDLLTMPLEPHEVYVVIPMAWRQCVGTAELSTRAADVKLTPDLAEASYACGRTWLHRIGRSSICACHRPRVDSVYSHEYIKATE